MAACTWTPAPLMDTVCLWTHTHVLFGVKLDSRGYGVCSKPIKVRPRWENPVPLCLGRNGLPMGIMTQDL